MSPVATRFSPSDLKDLVDVRRDLHAHPELAFEEVRTSKVVAERLKALALGKVGIPPGPVMAGVDEFDVTITGKGAHAAMPHFGIDPVVCSAHIITALQSIASRETSPLLEVVVSVTQVHAGSAFNIIPESVRLNGTCRMFDEEVWKSHPERFDRIVHGVA